MQSRADLHCHSRASDGLSEPSALVAHAAERGVRALALTDHDTTGGVAEAVAAGEALGIRVLPGVEISCLHGRREVHVLGLFIDPTNLELEELLRRSRSARDGAIEIVLKRLSAMGASIERDDVSRFAHGETLGRSHFARALVEKGHVSSTGEAFSRFLADGRPACVHRARPSVEEACRAIRSAGGVSSLAHPGGKPGLLSRDAVLEMARDGLDAIEAHHPAHDERTRQRVLRWADAMGLCISGGSDYHGSGEGSEIGSCFLDESDLFRLERRVASLRG